jgi:hypothetical protein
MFRRKSSFITTHISRGKLFTRIAERDTIAGILCCKNETVSFVGSQTT